MTGLASTLSTFPNFIVYFVVASALTGLFLFLYVNLTRQHDIAMIRNGNSAAAIALTGALWGFAIPLASVIAHSAALLDLLVWGVVALIVQLAGFVVARLVLPHLAQTIEQGIIADAVFLAGLSVSLGVLDAACMAG